MPRAKTTIMCEGVIVDECRNPARYLDRSGSYLCGICDAKTATPSVRISDLPDLIDAIVELKTWLGDGHEWDVLRAENVIAFISKRGVTFK